MRILLVEDHRELAASLAAVLTQHRFKVEHAYDGADADHLLLTQDYGLVILDLTLPRMDGLDVLKRLRARGARVPVLALTARGSVSDKVQGLTAGADDYLAKPFELAELEARVFALLRRAQSGGLREVSCGRLTFDSERRQFAVEGRALVLSPRPAAVLEVLISHAGKVVSKQQLFDKVFALDDDASAEAIEVYVHRLRAKLEGSGARITTLRGLGYVLEPADG